MPRPDFIQAPTLAIGHRYTVGDQPCQNLKRGEGYMGTANVHQCPKCFGNRTFCENCLTDHHDNGWKTCRPRAYECAEEDQPTQGETL